MARWYIIHAYSGFENKVRDVIMSEAQRLGLQQRRALHGIGAALAQSMFPSRSR